MSYQVLARKWRPRSFREMVGQTHVLKALINALDSQRLHHAYLFTGTRGVGKTTTAINLATALAASRSWRSLSESRLRSIWESPCSTSSTEPDVIDDRLE